MRQSTALCISGLGILLVLGACAESGVPSPTAPETQRSSTTQAPDPAPSTTPSTETTHETSYSIEVIQFAEAWGATLEEAAALLDGQTAQYLAMDRLYELVGEDIIVATAFSDFPRSDELTVFVVDEKSVAVVEARVVEAGLDPEKTTVEVAPEEPPYDPWDWLGEEPYSSYEWLESPGPHMLFLWQLVESNGVAPRTSLVAGFGPARWSMEPCRGWLGRLITSAAGTVTVTVDEENPDCADTNFTVDELVFDVIGYNWGGFEIVSEDNGEMTWLGTTGDTLVWRALDENLEPGDALYPIYPPNRPEIQETWSESPAPDMEGIWQLQQVGGDDPAAPVSLAAGVSILGFEGQCNAIEGFFAVSSNHRLGISLTKTDMGCGGPTGEVEEQMLEFLSQAVDLLQVSIEDDTMTWTTKDRSQMIWTR